jgi:hypothetical protein
MAKYKGQRVTPHYLDTSLTPNEYLPWDGKIKNTSSEPVFTSSAPYDKEYAEDGVYVYIGKAAPGSSTSSPVWQIQRSDNTLDPNFNWKFANGSAAFDKTWTSKTTYIY